MIYALWYLSANPDQYKLYRTAIEHGGLFDNRHNMHSDFFEISVFHFIEELRFPSPIYWHRFMLQYLILAHQSLSPVHQSSILAVLSTDERVHVISESVVPLKGDSLQISLLSSGHALAAMKTLSELLKRPSSFLFDSHILSRFSSPRSFLLRRIVKTKLCQILFDHDNRQCRKQCKIRKNVSLLTQLESIVLQWDMAMNGWGRVAKTHRSKG